MDVLWIFAITSMFQVAYSAKESMVQLKNNGYEDIVIAISPNTPENLNIITKIQSMLSDGSPYMLQATKNRVFIRSAKILIPSTWSNNSKYERPKTESFDKADVVIANSVLQDDNPYTLQYGACGEKGKYIHLTPNFLLDDKMLSLYGPRGRVFVHEWAHLRWGVFDEYNLDVPYYISGERKVEATRCPLSLRGVNKAGNADCKYDTKTGLYEKGCQFFIRRGQSVKESIMYAQGFDPVTQFCDKDSHNSEAPNLQNKLCNRMSTWEVIMKSPDMNSTIPLTNTSIPPPVISLLQYKSRVVTLVLDVSGSMARSNRIIRLYQASEVYIVQIIETGSYLGIVIFSSGATVMSELVKITDTIQREQLKKLLPTVTDGGTNICSGVREGFEVNKKHEGSTYGTEILLLTDGEDSAISSCFSEVEASGAVIHTIALGPDADIAFEQLATMTGGLKLYASDSVDANGLIDAFNGVVSSTGDVTLQSVQIESTTQSLGSSQCLNGTVIIDSTLGNDTFFLVTWNFQIPNITLTDPKNNIYLTNQFANDSVSKSARLAIPGTALTGTWRYSLCNTQVAEQVLGLTVNSRAADGKEPPVVVEAYMNADTSSYPNPLIVYTIITKGLSPVIGASVTAIIESQDGKTQDLQLWDNGVGGDVVKNDGIYSRYFTSVVGNGRYNLKVRVISGNNKSKLAARKNRALYIPGFDVNDIIESNPEMPSAGNLIVENFSRTASGGAFVVTNVPSGPLPDIYKPYQITNLDAVINGTQITLTWTATGDDLDQGNASRYDLRMSFSSQELIDSFVNATAINISYLTPKPAGSQEIFTFTPEGIELTNGTIIYFAMTAFDKINQQSDISNLGRAVLFIPPPPLPPPNPTTEPNSSVDIFWNLGTLIVFMYSIFIMFASFA